MYPTVEAALRASSAMAAGMIVCRLPHPGQSTTTWSKSQKSSAVSSPSSTTKSPADPNPGIPPKRGGIPYEEG